MHTVQELKDHLHAKIEDLKKKEKQLCEESLICPTIEDAIKKITEAQTLAEETTKTMKTLGYLDRVQKDLTPGSYRGISLT